MERRGEEEEEEKEEEGRTYLWAISTLSSFTFSFLLHLSST